MSMELLKKLRNETGAGIVACQKALKETNNNYDEAIDLLRKQGISKAVSKSDREAGEGLCCIVSNNTSFAIVKLNCETDFVAKNERFQSLIEQIANVVLNTKSKSIAEVETQNFNGASLSEMLKENIAVIGENIVLSEVHFCELKASETLTYYVHNPIEGKKNIGMIITVIVSSGVNDENSQLLLKQINMHIAAMSPIALKKEDVSSDIIEREKKIYEEQVAKLNKPVNIADKMVEGKINKFYEEKVLLQQTFVIDNKRKINDVIYEFNKDNNCQLEILDFKRVAIK